MEFQNYKRLTFITTMIMILPKLHNWRNGMLWHKNFSDYMKMIYVDPFIKNGLEPMEDSNGKSRNLSRVLVVNVPAKISYHVEADQVKSILMLFKTKTLMTPPLE